MTKPFSEFTDQDVNGLLDTIETTHKEQSPNGCVAITILWDREAHYRGNCSNVNPALLPELLRVVAARMEQMSAERN